LAAGDRLVTAPAQREVTTSRAPTVIGWWYGLETPAFLSGQRRTPLAIVSLSKVEADRCEVGPNRRTAAAWLGLPKVSKRACGSSSTTWARARRQGATHADAYIGIRVEIADIAGVAAVLGYDPAGRPLPMHPDHVSPALTRSSPPRLDQHVSRQEPCPSQQLHRRIEQVALEEPDSSAPPFASLVHSPMLVDAGSSPERAGELAEAPGTPPRVESSSLSP
jgi:hypothetical protein